MTKNIDAKVEHKQATHLSWWVVAALFLPALVYLPPLLGGIPYPAGESQFTDLLIAHYPNLLYLKQSLVSSHQLPFWFSSIYSGTPFAANPLAGLYYLPGWLGMFFPLPLGIIIVTAAHSVFGAWGMYLLLHRLRLDRMSSVIGALCFGMMPKLAAHFGAGHISLVYAVAWTPWLLAVSLSDKKGWITGSIAGMLFLADPRWSIYAGLLYAGFVIAYRNKCAHWNPIFFLKSAVSAVLIAAPLILPLIEYLPLTTRTMMESGDLVRYRLPLRQLVGLILPLSGGNVEWYIYGGGSVLAIFIAQLILWENWRRTAFWNLSFFISILLGLSLGAKAVSWTANIPIVSLLRVPARSMFLAGFSLAGLVGFTLDFIVINDLKTTKIIKAGFGCLVFSVIFGWGIFIITGELSWPIIWGLGFFALTSLVLMVVEQIAHAKLIILLGILVILDSMGAGWQAYQVKRNNQRTDPAVLEYINKDQSRFRTYSPSYSLTQDKAVENSLEITDGVDPLQLSAYSLYMEKATGVTGSGYSVTIPPFKTGDPDADNKDSKPDFKMLGILNVKYVISEFPIESEDLIPINVPSSQYLYQNQDFLPRAWVEQDGVRIDKGIATIIRYSPNRVELEASGPGNLILSATFYPGWKVYIDGQKAEITPAYQILRQVPLPDGKHTVVFVFRPLSVYAGLALAGAGWMLVIFQMYRKQY